MVVVVVLGGMYGAVRAYLCYLFDDDDDGERMLSTSLPGRYFESEIERAFDFLLSILSILDASSVLRRGLPVLGRCELSDKQKKLFSLPRLENGS